MVIPRKCLSLPQAVKWLVVVVENPRSQQAAAEPDPDLRPIHPTMAESTMVKTKSLPVRRVIVALDTSTYCKTMNVLIPGRSPLNVRSATSGLLVITI